MSPLELSQKIKNITLELGFSKIGITPAQYHPQDDEYIQAWIDKGRHATMDWVVRRKDERANIFEYYPQAKSVIVVGLNYYTGLSPEEDGIARFSNYAWGDDYHDLLKKKLYHLLFLFLHLQIFNFHLCYRMQKLYLLLHINKVCFLKLVELNEDLHDLNHILFLNIFHAIKPT